MCVCNKLRLGKNNPEDRETRLGRLRHSRHSSCRLCRGVKDGTAPTGGGNVFVRQQSLLKPKQSATDAARQLSTDEPIVPIHELDHQLSHSNCSANSANSEKRKHFKFAYHKPCFFEENESEALKRLEKIRLQSF